MPSAYRLPPGYTLARTMLGAFRFLRDPIKTITYNLNKFGGTYSARLPQHRRMIVTDDPAFVNYILKENQGNYHKSELSADRAAVFFGKGLLFTNGEYWLRQRRLIQPGFHREKIRGLYDIVVRTVEGYMKTFPTGDAIDVYPLMHQLSFEMLMHSLFDLEMRPEAVAELRATFTDVQEFLMKEVHHPLERLLYPLTGKERRMLVRTSRVREIIKGMVAERRQDKGTYNDLLDMLLSARYEDTGKAMEEEQLVDEILILLFAGHETTANALSWLLYLLAGNPEVQERLSRVGGDVFDSPKNDYLNAVINEGMRLFPPAWMTERVAVEDDGFGGFTYPKGTIVIPFFYGVHRNAQYWERPADFDPERFMGEKKNKAFFPFGGGPRLCIGNGFALAEMAIFLHTFFKEYTLRPTGQVPRLRPLITLRPSAVLLSIGPKEVYERT